MTTPPSAAGPQERSATGAAIRVTALETAGLGNRCHVASDGSVAVVVDPPRDVDRCLALCGRLGARVTWILETHVHNDCLSGGLELARITGASYGLAAAEEVAFADRRVGLSDGDVVETGAMRLRALHTPGHTPHHLAYVLSEVSTDRPLALFSGGSWLHGTAGRTDLLGEALTHELSRAQWTSIRRLAAELPDSVELRPTHGFGSFCAAGETPGGEPGTLGDERAAQAALLLDEADFVRQLIAGLVAHPRYYARMGPLNRRGPEPIDLRPAPEAGPQELARRVAAGEWVVDLRPRRVFATVHAGGWINLEAGDDFATYLGWLLPGDTPVTLAAEDAEVVAGAHRAMARIGIDRPAAQVARPFEEWTGETGRRSYPLARFADLAAAGRGSTGPQVLDVRRDDEWRARHIAGAHHLPLTELDDRVGEAAELSRRGPLWVHCEAGFRASIAASLLDARGIPVVLVDDRLAEAAAAGLELERGPAPG